MLSNMKTISMLDMGTLTKEQRNVPGRIETTRILVIQNWMEKILDHFGIYIYIYLNDLKYLMYIYIYIYFICIIIYIYISCIF